MLLLAWCQTSESLPLFKDLKRLGIVLTRYQTISRVVLGKAQPEQCHSEGAECNTSSLKFKNGMKWAIVDFIIFTFYLFAFFFYCDVLKPLKWKRAIIEKTVN